jgi:hypothetical protein
MPFLFCWKYLKPLGSVVFTLYLNWVWTDGSFLQHWITDTWWGILYSTPTELTPWSRVLLDKPRVRSASPEIPRILRNPKAHHRVNKSSPPAPILSQMNSIHIPKPYFPKMHLNGILSSTPRSFQWSPPFRPPNQNFVCTSDLPHARHMPRPSHPPCFDHPNITGWRVQTMQLLIMQFSPTSCYFIPRRFFNPQTKNNCQIGLIPYLFIKVNHIGYFTWGSPWN